MKTILCALCALGGAIALPACSTAPNAPQVSEVGSAMGGAYTNPKTGEQYAGQASSYVKFQGKSTGNFQPPSASGTSDPKQVKEPAILSAP